MVVCEGNACAPTLKLVHKRVNPAIDSQSGDLRSLPTKLRAKVPTWLGIGEELVRWTGSSNVIDYRTTPLRLGIR